MLTAAAVADMLGLKPRTVYDLARRGELASYRFGAALRFDHADVEAYKAQFPGLYPPPRPMLSATALRRLIRVGGGEYLTPEEREIANTRYRRQVLASWADGAKVRALYADAKRLTTETGVQHHVDHILPLQGEFVSGLHVETNLRVVTERENLRKRNKVES